MHREGKWLRSVQCFQLSILDAKRRGWSWAAEQPERPPYLGTTQTDGASSLSNPFPLTQSVYLVSGFYLPYCMFLKEIQNSVLYSGQHNLWKELFWKNKEVNIVSPVATGLSHQQHHHHCRFREVKNSYRNLSGASHSDYSPPKWEIRSNLWKYVFKTV